ncbi:MAG: hypothetical protein P0Y66_11635 [Candidatus Kaistia colombiensis]|nr:MAG: hypothetical protein P0Y66_11635 [Kaistia sp.]
MSISSVVVTLDGKADAGGRLIGEERIGADNPQPLSEQVGRIQGAQDASAWIRYPAEADGPVDGRLALDRRARSGKIVLGFGPSGIEGYLYRLCLGAPPAERFLPPEAGFRVVVAAQQIVRPGRFGEDHRAAIALGALHRSSKSLETLPGIDHFPALVIVKLLKLHDSNSLVRIEAEVLEGIEARTIAVSNS